MIESVGLSAGPSYFPVYFPFFAILHLNANRHDVPLLSSFLPQIFFSGSHNASPFPFFFSKNSGNLNDLFSSPPYQNRLSLVIPPPPSPFSSMVRDTVFFWQ